MSVPSHKVCKGIVEPVQHFSDQIILDYDQFTNKTSVFFRNEDEEFLDQRGGCLSRVHQTNQYTQCLISYQFDQNFYKTCDVLFKNDEFEKFNTFLDSRGLQVQHTDTPHTPYTFKTRNFCTDLSSVKLTWY
jgi:hypothetical protein